MKLSIFELSSVKRLGKYQYLTFKKKDISNSVNAMQFIKHRLIRIQKQFSHQFPNENFSHLYSDKYREEKINLKKKVKYNLFCNFELRKNTH